MTTVVFVGPTLASQRVLQELPDAEVFGPAARGDIYRATRRGATTIVLIDGYFDQELAVWHKEVLWALARRIRVYGGASMGALRAAELQHFGMIGVGRIFDWYMSGVIEADDEVAVAHESAERGYRVVSEAMVNLRATFLAAENAAVIRPDTTVRLIEVGRAIFYPFRSIREVRSRAARTGVDLAELDSLDRWLVSHPDNLVDQKRADALAVLERARLELATQEAGSADPPFTFEYTEVWHELTRQITAEEEQDPALVRPAPHLAADGDEPPASTHAWTERVMALLETTEPRLAGSLQQEAERRAALLALAARRPVEVDAAVVQATANEFREERGLLTREQTQLWLNERALDIAEFSEWMQEEALILRALPLVAPAKLQHVIRGSLDPAVLRAISEVNHAMQGNPESEGSLDEERERTTGGSGAEGTLSGAEA